MRACGAVALLLLAACSSGKVKQVVGCAQDSDCGDPAQWQCDTKTGVCHCRSSDACNKGELCNSAGFCQAKVTCYTNADCPADQICDFHANVCISKGRCTTDDQCPIGQICDHGTLTCQAGCHSYGDCPTGNSCLCTDSTGNRAECSCSTLDPQARTACAVGACSTDACPNTASCPYGELCRAADAGLLPQCVSDYDPDNRPYCDACTAAPGTNSYCGDGPNFCLLDTANGNFGGSFCGADCSQGQACPSGFFCDDVVVVRSIGCGADSDCPTNSVACQADADCANGGLCQKPSGALTGYCSGRCYKSEGAARGFCTCVIDSECDQDQCESSSRRCSITRRDCSTTQGCPPIHCVNFQGVGGCFIGQNCVPLEGLGCADVRHN